jgi:hypothetical protein
MSTAKVQLAIGASDDDIGKHRDVSRRRGKQKGRRRRMQRVRQLLSWAQRGIKRVVLESWRGRIRCTTQ